MKKKSLERQVWERAAGTCEYCRLPQTHHPVPFEIDHIVSQQHEGKTVSSNLALSCMRCNKRKGPNLSGIDPETGQVVRLFHPRQDQWNDHFQWDGPFIRGRTEIGRATIAVLALNDRHRISVREGLLASGGFSSAQIATDSDD